MYGSQSQLAARVQRQIAKPGLAEPDCLLEHGLEHGLQLPGRSRDDLQNLRGRRLPLQGLGELLFQTRTECALATHAHARLRSGRTKLATVRSAFRALAGQGHPRGTSIDPTSPGHRHLKDNTAGPVGEAIYGSATDGNAS